MSSNNAQGRQLPSLTQGFTTPSPGVPNHVQHGLRLPFDMHNYPSTAETSRTQWSLAPLQSSQWINRPANAVFSYDNTDKRAQVSSPMPNMYNRWAQPQPSGQQLTIGQPWNHAQPSVPLARGTTLEIARQPIVTSALKLPQNSSRYEMDFGIKDVSAKDFILQWLGKKSKMTRWLGKKQAEKLELMEELRKALVADQYKDRKATSFFEQVSHLSRVTHPLVT